MGKILGDLMAGIGLAFCIAILVMAVMHPEAWINYIINFGM